MGRSVESTGSYSPGRFWSCAAIVAVHASALAMCFALKECRAAFPDQGCQVQMQRLGVGYIQGSFADCPEALIVDSSYYLLFCGSLYISFEVHCRDQLFEGLGFW